MPVIRIALRESAVEIKVRFLIDVKSKNAMNSRLNALLLEKLDKERDIKFAYPHIQLKVDRN